MHQQSRERCSEEANADGVAAQDGGSFDQLKETVEIERDSRPDGEQIHQKPTERSSEDGATNGDLDESLACEPFLAQLEDGHKWRLQQNN